jgi:3-deoxy-manno-octulosonate cytidylyltransferase (CMP-KDO synthetase)
MDRGPVVAVIPARYDSNRFPGKPLVRLAGREMIAHVVDRVRAAAGVDLVLVATDDQRIAAVAAAAGAEVAMTGYAASGTDRVALAVRGRDARVVINVQGDEPALPPADVSAVAAFLCSHPEVPMATLAIPLAAEDLDNPSIVKVVCDLRGRALYFSRASIPYPRNPIPGFALRHVGLYGFQRSALETFTALGEAELERIEGLEQLRALANGIEIQVLQASGVPVAVDTPDDVARAEQAVRALEGGS